MFRVVLSPFPDLIWRAPASTNKIYLTFDDGPYPPVTLGVLEILNVYKIPALFFLSGIRIQEHQLELKKLSYDSHRLGNHGFYHEPVIFKNGTRLSREVSETDRLIQKYFHKNTIYFRPPYGIWGPQLLRFVRTHSKRMVLWSVPANDFKWPASRIYAQLIKRVEPGDIIVFHDSQKTAHTILEVLPRFIEYCLQNHLEFGLL
jgi:peptidoglycan/xylan/chitin deacetylase (PgdA/CDA1 family)